MHIVGNTNLQPLLNAFQKFERFRVNDKTEQERAGTIQAFEYCFELSWKTMKRLLEERGVTTNSPKETFRAAALEGFISSTDIWFEFLQKRNLTVHTYNPKDADAVIAVTPLFSQEVRMFLHNLGIENA